MSGTIGRVLVSDKLSPVGLKLLEEAHDVEFEVAVGLSEGELAAKIRGFDALLIRSGTKVTAGVLEGADALRVVGRAGIGVDNVDLKAATERGVLVMNTPDGNVVTTGEHAIALICSMMRKIPQATRRLQEGGWDKSKFQGREMTGKVLGVVGLGNIGRIVANRGLGLHFRVIASDPFVTEEKAKEMGVTLVPLERLLREADIVTLHVPLLDSTRNLIDAEAIQSMKDGAYLVNGARGGLVDEAAVAEALQSGKLAAAAFDVYATEPPPADHPFRSLDNIVLTPHLGASTQEAQQNVSRDVVEQVLAYLRTGEVRNAVNAPAVSASMMETLRPFMGLAQSVALTASQLHDGPIESIRLCFGAQAATLDTRPMTATAVSDILARGLGASVNTVNALSVAKSRGISVTEERCGDAAPVFRIEVSGGDKRTAVEGALFGDAPRISHLLGVPVDVVPVGHAIVTQHSDRPGIVGGIGSILGAHDTNISRMTVGQSPERPSLAAAVLSIDRALSEAAVEAIRALDGIEDVRLLRFPEAA